MLAPGVHLKPLGKLVVRDLDQGEFVAGHSHPAGHFCIIDGDATVTMLGGAHRLTHGALWVPAGVVHDIKAHGRTRMYCAGGETF